MTCSGGLGVKRDTSNVEIRGSNPRRSSLFCFACDLYLSFAAPSIAAWRRPDGGPEESLLGLCRGVGFEIHPSP
jgi:hypothetical protein